MANQPNFEDRIVPYGIASVVGHPQLPRLVLTADVVGTPSGENEDAEMPPPPPPYPLPPKPHGWSRMTISWMSDGVLITKSVGWARLSWDVESDHWTAIFHQDPELIHI